MSSFLPLLLASDGLKCLIVGGGAVAERRMQTLLDANADILVVAPKLSDPIIDAARQGKIRTLEGPFNQIHLESVTLVVAATNQPDVNELVLRLARERGILCNQAADADSGDVQFPSTVRRGDLILTVATGGKSPALAARLSAELSNLYGETYAILLNLLGEQREKVFAATTDPVLRRKALSALAADDTIIDLLEKGRIDAARESDTVHIVVVGLNHRTAPIEIRERLTFTETSHEEALRQLTRREGVHEAAIISTCNRSEVYAVVADPGKANSLSAFLSDFHTVPQASFTSHLYTHVNQEAIAHLLRVGSGLDSLVLGEPQILRQVRDAFEYGSKTNAVGHVLNGLFRAAITTGRRARTETGIGRGGFSIGHAAVDLAGSIFGSLNGATILILGAGKMSELTARHLVASGAKFVLVANRTYQRAEALAARLGGQAIHYDVFPERLAGVDVVISSTASPHPVLHKQDIQPTLRKRRGRPLFLIDIAVPRDIAPEVGTLDNVFLYDVDDLQAVVSDMARERSSEVQKVEKLVAEETAQFLAWWKSRDAAPLITALRARNEDIQQSEITRLRNQLPSLSEREWTTVEAAMRSLMNRIQREPINRVRQDAEGTEARTLYSLAEAARELFAIDQAQIEGSADSETVEVCHSQSEPAPIEEETPA